MVTEPPVKWCSGVLGVGAMVAEPCALTTVAGLPGLGGRSPRNEGSPGTRVKSSLLGTFDLGNQMKAPTLREENPYTMWVGGDLITWHESGSFLP